jgi:hypothetical protein
LAHNQGVKNGSVWLQITSGGAIMGTFLLTLLVGVVVGTIDILPMLKMKLDKHAILSAFVFYLIVPFFIYNTDLFGMAWWLKGAVITLLLAIPVIILVAKEGLKGAIPIAAMSIILGTLIGLMGKFVLNTL